MVRGVVYFLVLVKVPLEMMIEEMLALVETLVKRKSVNGVQLFPDVGFEGRMADRRSGLVVETGHRRVMLVVGVAIGSRREMLRMRVMGMTRSVGKWCRHRGHKWSCRWVEAVMRRRFRFPMVAMVQRSGRWCCA